MIKKRDIIVFGDDWGRYPSTIQYLAQELAKDNRILWIGSLGLRKPKFHYKDFKRIYEKGEKIFQVLGNRTAGKMEISIRSILLFCRFMTFP